ncbi:unnamed protein product [Arctogadus glacialis]
MVYCDYKHSFFPYCSSWQIASAFYCAVNKAGALPQQVWRPATGLETTGLETTGLDTRNSSGDHRSGVRSNRAGDQRFGDHKTGYPQQVWRHATELETRNRSGDRVSQGPPQVWKLQETTGLTETTAGLTETIAGGFGCSLGLEGEQSQDTAEDCSVQFTTDPLCSATDWRHSAARARIGQTFLRFLLI